MSEKDTTFNSASLPGMNEELEGLTGSCSGFTQVIALKTGFIVRLLKHSSAILHLDTGEKRKNDPKHRMSLRGEILE